MKQAIERTDNLIALSEVACPAIDTRAGRQENARLFLRMGMQALADIVEGAYGEGLVAGEHISHSYGIGLNEAVWTSTRHFSHGQSMFNI